MKHVDDIELMEYIAGNLAASRDGEVREHLAACEECSARRREATQMWKALGQWDVDTTDHDVAARITVLAENAGRERAQGEKTHVLRVGFLPVVLRVEPVAVSKNGPEYLAAFGLEWSSELAWLILEDDSSNTGEDQ